MNLKSLFTRFRSEEDGAVTVDWVVLAAWDGATLLYSNTHNLPTTMPCGRHAFALDASEIALSTNMSHYFEDYGYGLGTGTDGQGTLFDGSLTFAPLDNWANFGAPGGGLAP